MDAAKIIEDLGDTVAVSQAVGVAPSAISNWKMGGIPPRHWLTVARLAAQKAETKHITLDELERHTFPGRPRAEAAARSVA